MDKEKAVDEILMEIGEALFGDGFRNRFDMYCNRKKELRLNDVSASICKALNDYGVPSFKGQAIHSQILCELFPKEEFEEKEKTEEKAEKAETKAKMLEDTVDDMLSNDYKDRFVAEFNQLSFRIERLQRILDALSEGITVQITSPVTILQDQLNSMKTYRESLKRRCYFEHIREDKLWQ